jgi:rhodanese-related sulfurtransferase
MNSNSLKNVGKVTPTQLRRLMEGKAPTLVDVRGYGEFAQSRLSASICIPIDELTARLGEIPTRDPVVCICATGRRSETAARQLETYGIAAQSLEGGLVAWKHDGFPTWNSLTWSLERQVRLCAGILVLLGLAVGNLWAPGRLLAWAVGAGLVIAALSNSCLMGRVLMGMPWNGAQSDSKSEPRR